MFNTCIQLGCIRAEGVGDKGSKSPYIGDDEHEFIAYTQPEQFHLDGGNDDTTDWYDGHQNSYLNGVEVERGSLAVNRLQFNDTHDSDG